MPDIPNLVIMDLRLQLPDDILRCTGREDYQNLFSSATRPPRDTVISQRYVPLYLADIISLPEKAWYNRSLLLVGTMDTLWLRPTSGSMAEETVHVPPRDMPDPRSFQKPHGFFFSGPIPTFDKRMSDIRLLNIHSVFLCSQNRCPIQKVCDLLNRR